jgi:hypothetical protein
MRQKEFDYWADILKSHFPDFPRIEELGKEFRPNTQIFLTALRNRWLGWKMYARSRLIAIQVDIEDWLAKILPQKTGAGDVNMMLKPSQPFSEDPDRVEIFVSYSHIPDDSYVVFKLLDYLERRFNKLTEGRHKAVSISCIRKVGVSTGWQDEVDENYFLAANYTLLMITPDYLASDYCRRQMKQVEQREQKGSAKVIPVILRPVEWSPPALWELLPSNGRPLTNWPDRDEAFANIAEGILRAIPAEIQQRWVDHPIPWKAEW